MPSPSDAPQASFPVGGGAMGEAIRAHDWAASPLGPSAGWPAALRVALGLVLNSPESMFLAWGPDLAFFYNDALVPMLGQKATGALGRPTADLWSDVWDQVSPIVEATLAGRASRFVDLPLTMSRNGVEEQTWWSFSYSPLADEDGAIVGLFCVADETTGRVLDGLKLREDREVATAVAEVGGVGSWSIDLGTEVCTLSARMAALLDLPAGPATMASSAWRARVFPDDRGLVEAAFARCVEGGRPYDVEFRASSDDGSIKWFRSYGGVVRDASGTPTRLQGASVDITAPKRAEERQREGQARLASALSIAELGTFDWDLPTGGVTLDDRSRGIFGFADGVAVTAAEVFGRIHPSDVERVRAEARAAATAGVRLENEYRIVLPDGAVRTLASTGEPVLAPDGTTRRMFGVFRDVTGERRAQDRQAFLLGLGDRLRSVVEPDEVVSIATRSLGEHLRVGRCTYGEVVGDGTTLVIERDWTDGTMSSHTGRMTLDDFGPEMIDQLRAGHAVRCDDVLRDERTRLAAGAFALVGGIRSGMAVPLVRDGVLRALVSVVGTAPRAWSDDDGILLWETAERVWSALGRARAEEDLRRANEGLEARVADAVAERLRSEEALRQSQKMEAVGQLTGGVAHDFNNLLTVLRSSIDLLRRPDLAAERRRRYLDAISDTVDRAAKLTGQLLAFSRRQALKPEVFDAGGRLEAIADMLDSVTGSRVRISFESPGEACHVLADASQFETALVNMAVNARDAMAGEGTLTLRVRGGGSLPPIRGHGGSAAPFVAVALTDTGVGIPADRLARIFEPFFTTKGVGKGTGLGLSQVFGFAKQSGGDVDVESAEGVGTTFTLYLPRVPAPAFEERAERQGNVEGGGGRRVLVVEDNVEIGRFAMQILDDLGYRTAWAANAAEALASLGSSEPGFDVVFSDVVMPGMDGVDLAREIRRRYPDLPVVLTSGYSHVLAEEGPHGFDLVHKPYSAGQVADALNRARTG